MTAWLDTLLFGIYPYICLAVFFIGSLIRFDRDQYTWKSDSSQLLRTGSLRWGSNLFHIGVLFLFFGHFVGMLTPHFIYEHFIGAGAKQLMAMVSGGIAGVLGIIGLSLLLHRRLTDPRIRITSKTSDIVLLWLLWAQFALGGAAGRSRLGLQGPYVPGHDRVPDLPVHPSGARMERFWHVGLRVASLPVGACTPFESPRRAQPAFGQVIDFERLLRRNP